MGEEEQTQPTACGGIPIVDPDSNGLQLTSPDAIDEFLRITGAHLCCCCADSPCLAIPVISNNDSVRSLARYACPMQPDDGERNTSPDCPSSGMAVSIGSTAPSNLLRNGRSCCTPSGCVTPPCFLVQIQKSADSLDAN